MLNINLHSTPHGRRCRFNPILKVALTGRTVNSIWKGWFNVVV